MVRKEGLGSLAFGNLLLILVTLSVPAKERGKIKLKEDVNKWKGF